MSVYSRIEFWGDAAKFILAQTDLENWGIFIMMKSHQTKQHKTNRKHQITHANQLNSGKFCILPVGQS